MDLAVFGMRTGRLSAQIEAAEARNKEKDQLGVLLRNQGQLYDQLKKLFDAYSYGIKMIGVVTTQYKNARTAALEENVENTMELAFPDEHFKIKIDYDTRGKQEIATLSIGKMQANGEIKWGSPHCRSGDFAKQLISLCIVSEITMMLGSEMLMADEPLSNGDKISLAEINAFFQRLSEQGLQTVFIEHEEEMYQGLERREIILEKDRSSGIVQVVSNQRERGESDTLAGTEADMPSGEGVFEADGAVLLGGE